MGCAIQEMSNNPNGHSNMAAQIPVGGGGQSNMHHTHHIHQQQPTAQPQLQPQQLHHIQHHLPADMKQQQRQKQQQQQHSQLKQSHSALVKILESAPIKQSQTPPQHQQPSHQHQQHQSSIAMPLAAAETAAHNGECRPTHHHHYRKRAKHLAHISVGQRLSAADPPSSGDDERPTVVAATAIPPVPQQQQPQQQQELPQQQQRTNAESICPWKKTRIAKEWRQQRESQDSDDLPLPIVAPGAIAPAAAIERMLVDTDEDGMEADVDDVDEAYDSACECATHGGGARRTSTSTDESCGCCGEDSDGTETETELCKKFEENLSEKDVNAVITHIHTNTLES